jgi:hypothetical protein
MKNGDLVFIIPNIPGLEIDRSKSASLNVEVPAELLRAVKVAVVERDTSLKHLVFYLLAMWYKNQVKVDF